MKMAYNIKVRDGPARIGEFDINGKKIITPNILFINTSKFTAPSFAEVIITNNQNITDKPSLKVSKSLFFNSHLKNKDEFLISDYFFYPKDLPKELLLSAIKSYNKKYGICYIIPGSKETINETLDNNPSSFFIVGNAHQLFHQQSKFVDFIVTLREKIGYQKIIQIPSIGDPINISLLSYIGIDFFDSLSAILAARNKNLLFPTGYYNINNLKEIPCSCPSCKGFKGKPSMMTYEQILSHNYLVLFNEIKQVRNAIYNGNLRELVESRVRACPLLTAILKCLDQQHYKYIEKRTPITRKSQLLATTNDSLYRAEIKRFQERVINRYYKPESAKILLLLPCSVKKPYSFSKSHKRYREKIYNLDNPHIIHEVIITSPLGIVPRELELTYPASAYDIPVSGYWNENEKRMIQDLLKRYLEINKYEKIILHLPLIIRKFIDKTIGEYNDTDIESNPTSKESLNKLLRVLKKETITYDRVKFSIRKRENLESLASYQFGKKISKKLLKDCEIKGKYPYQKIIYNNKQLGMLTKERGFISLTLTGAKKIANFKKYWVKIYDDFTLEGSVFAPGVQDADELIREGDETYILQGNKLCAVGVAQMNGEEMKKSTHGEAIKIRHKN